MNNKGLILTFLTLSIILGLSSSSFFFFWISLELNSLIFCFLLNLDKSSNGSLPSMKYFLIQALSSSLFFATNLWIPLSNMNPSTTQFFLTLSIFLKLGMFPCHYWLLNLSNSLKWTNFILLMTIQKILPLFFLHTITLSFSFLMISFLGMIVSPLSCFLVSSTQKILVYSSVFSLSWLTSLTSFNLSISILFFISYSILLSILSLFMKNTSSLFTHQLMKKTLSFNSMILFFIASCSLGGFPPSLGFLMKITFLKELIYQNTSLFFLMICVMSSVFMLSFYISLNLIFLPWYKSSFFIKPSLKPSLLPWLIIFVNFISLSFFISLYNPSHLFWK